MKEEKGFLKLNQLVGNGIYSFFVLQLLTVFYTLIGGVILGLFPAITSMIHVCYKWIQDRSFDSSLFQEYRHFYRHYFWETNKLGWFVTGIGLILGIDFYVSYIYLQSIVIHCILLLIIGIYLVICLYLFPVFVRYNLTFFQYVKQAFFIGFASIAQTVAAMLAAGLILYLSYRVSFILLFFGLPLMGVITTWFTNQGMDKAEEAKVASID